MTNNIKNFDILKSSLDGTTLIEASAGTGKTYTIANIYLRLILEKNLLVNEILAVTFTEAATKELCSRIRTRIKHALLALTQKQYNDDVVLIGIAQKYKDDKNAVMRLREAIRNFDEAAIFTIHGFCNKMLSENSFESGSLFDPELLKDETELKQQVVQDFYRINISNESEMFLQYLLNENIKIDIFYSLVKKIPIDPSFKVIPVLMKPDYRDTETGLKKSFLTMSEEWKSARSEIISIFDSGILNGKRYTAKIKDRIIIAMDEFTVSENPIAVIENFEKLTKSFLINSGIKKGAELPELGFFELCDDYYETYNNLIKQYDKYVLHLKAKLFDFVEAAMTKEKLKSNKRSFDDLLKDINRALTSSGAVLAENIRKKYKAALVDEFQDTDPLQYEIFIKLFGRESALFLIGDPKQAIYKFRDADIFAYLKAASDAANKYTLEYNWRSHPKLIDAVNLLFSRLKNPFLIEQINFIKVKSPDKERDCLTINGHLVEPLQIWLACDEDKKQIAKTRAINLIAHSVASEISQLVNHSRQNMALIGSKPVSAGDIAVLCRKKNQARIVYNNLVELGIPSVVYKSDSVFNSQEAVQLERVMRSIIHCTSDQLLKAALATDMIGMKAKEIVDLAADEKAYEERVSLFAEYNAMWQRHGFMSMFFYLLNKENARIRLLGYFDGERRVTNLMHCAELLHNAENENHFGMDELLKWFADKRNEESVEEYQLRLEKDEDAVKIITMHSSKGLEFPIVFCPFTWEDSSIKTKNGFAFHDSENSLVLDIGTNDADNIRRATNEELAENLRLLYVALTRAKYRCYLAWGHINKTHTSALAYLFYEPHDKDNPAIELNNIFKELDSGKMYNDIVKLANISDGSISVTQLPDISGELYTPEFAKEKFQSAKFNGKIHDNWAITSYSSIIKGIEEEKDFDGDINYKTEIMQSGNTIFDFPRGAVAGTCIHEILQDIDFAAETDITIISDKLSRFGFGYEWTDAVACMINNIVTTHLDSEIILKNINKNDRLSELEFYFPVKTVKLASVFKKYSNAANLTDFYKRLEKHGTDIQGFLKGFVDLIFQYNNKYYIVDWKSNHLGDRVEDYSYDNLRYAMHEHYYILQYHLYALALHRYLRLRLADYKYSKHFGGIFYIFVRCIDKAHGSRYGVYSDLPDENLIIDLDNCIKEGGFEKRS